MIPDILKLSLFWLACFATGILSFFLALLVFFKVKDRKISLTFFFYYTTVALWSTCLGLKVTSPSYEEALFWAKWLHILVVFIGPTYLLFILAYVNKLREKIKLLIILFSLTGLLILLNLQGLIITDVQPKFYFLYYATAGPFYPGLLLIFAISVFYAFYELIADYKKSNASRRNQIKYFLFSSIIAYTAGCAIYLPIFNISVPFFTMLLLFIHPAIVSYAIMKNSLMDIKLAITRTSIFLVVYTLALGLPFYIGYKTKEWFLSTSFAVLLATLSPFIFNYLRKKAEVVILRKQQRYQKILLQVASGMTREYNLARLAKLIVYILRRVVRITFTAIFIDDKESGHYLLQAMRGVKVQRSLTSAYDHPLVVFLKTRKEPIFYEELPEYIKRMLIFPENITLIIPLLMQNNLLGFIFLGEKINRQPYLSEDIDIFKILAHQAAMSIENCLFFTQSQKFQERIYAAEKLASIGGMADGLAHQIKNRLNHFSVAAGEMQFEISDFIRDNKDLVDNQPKLKKSYDYLNEVTSSILANVKKTDGIIQGILNFAAIEEKEMYFNQVSLKEVIESGLNILVVKHEIAEFPLYTNVRPEDKLYAIKSQLIEVIYNLLDNSYEAIQDMLNNRLGEEDRKNYNPNISLLFSQTDKFYKLSISDNGSGIKRENQQKIFAPFFTTKSSFKSGSGIGMYVVKRLIEENHKGNIWFTSEYLKGTTVFIDLPKPYKGEEDIT